MTEASNLTTASLEHILAAIPRLTVGVLGDLFLDRYLDIDAALTEQSLETGLDAYQVVGVRPYPGAAGTVINNLVALGVKEVCPVAVLGDDGEGYELGQALTALRVVSLAGLIARPDRRTPTYIKLMLHEAGKPPRELNRLDIKNRTPLPPDAEEAVLAALAAGWPKVDALVVLDQVSEAECGAVTTRVRQRLAELGEAEPGKLILADSRERIGLFRSVWLKPNFVECRRAVRATSNDPECAMHLARQVGRPVFCTIGDKGILIADPRTERGQRLVAPAYRVDGPIDIVGAGDATAAALACALAAEASPLQAAAFGNLVASITIQQIGATGTASPEQVRQRWREVGGS